MARGSWTVEMAVTGGQGPGGAWEGQAGAQGEVRICRAGTWCGDLERLEWTGWGADACHRGQGEGSPSGTVPASPPHPGLDSPLRLSGSESAGASWVRRPSPSPRGRVPSPAARQEPVDSDSVAWGIRCWTPALPWGSYFHLLLVTKLIRRACGSAVCIAMTTSGLLGFPAST